MLATSLVVCLLLGAQGEPKPKLPVGKETTYVTGPLDKEGYLDYEAALNDRLGKDILPEKNANVLLWKAMGPGSKGGPAMPAAFFKRLGMAAPPQEGDYLVGLHPYMRDHLKLDASKFNEIYDQQNDATQRPWAAKDFPHIAGWLKVNEGPLAVVVEATRRPDYFNPLVSLRKENEPGSLIAVLLPGVQRCRDFGSAFSARAMLRVQEGKFDEAWQDLLACHRLGRLLGRGATIIEALVGIAIDQLACEADLAYLERAKLTPKQVQERLKDLQDLPPLPSMADKVDVGERFMYLDSVQLIRRGGANMMEYLAGAGKDAKNGMGAKKPTKEELQALDKIDWGPALRNGNLWYNKTSAALRLKDRAERVKTLSKLEADLKALKIEVSAPAILARIFVATEPPDKTASKALGDVMIGLFMPAVRSLMDSSDRTEQAQRNLHVAFALAAYRVEHNRYPAKLDELAPKHLAAVPNDLYSKKALVYRPSEKGYLLYSIGANGEDEEGRWYDDTPPGDDPRVRMPLPERKIK